MASEWPQRVLEEVAELSGGFAFKSEDYSPDGRFVLRTLNIKDDGSIHRDDAVFLPLEKCDLYKRFELQEHDTLFVMVGATLGKVGYVRREALPALLNQNMWRIRGRDGLCDKRYLQYAFRHTVVKSLGWASGSARDFVRRDDYRTMEIPVPPLTEQKAIAAVLGALDDKIELNRRMNATLEAMARALFQSWFVDFDPVRAKLDGRKPVGMDSVTAALFPDQFHESELGQIPSGWHIGRIRDEVEDVFDGPHATPSESAEGPVFLGIKNLTGAALDLTEINHISESDGPRWTRRVTPRHLDIVFSYEATLGFFALIPPHLGCCLGRRLALIRTKSSHGHPHFWLHQFVGTDFQRYLIQHSVQGATVDRVPLIQFPNYRVLSPLQNIKAAFEERAAPLWSKIHANNSQSQTLITLRDTLLPKLLSGELSVAALESQLEAGR